MRHSMKDDLRQRQESLDTKLQHAEEYLIELQKERESEDMLKREVRKLRDEDFRVLVGRLKRKDVSRKQMIIEREQETAESVERARTEREKWVMANNQRH